MAILSNDYQHLSVWDLCTGGQERGPFLVTQAGVAPGSDAVEDGLYVLRRDGSWVHISIYLAAERPEAVDEAMFDSTHQVVELLEQLSGDARVLNPPLAEDRLQDWLKGASALDTLERVRQLARDYLLRRDRPA